MIVGTGADLVEIERIRGVYERHGERFLSRVLTGREREYCLRHRDPAPRLAGRWAAKEAAMKALGTGLSGGVSWRDFEILPDARGRPELRLSGKAAELAAAMGAERYHVTITHSRDAAFASVIFEDGR
ncbi:MAG: holo-ACP synthase [Planctomycetota bacterium]|nr:holo-ACP synthase [Planctomycetota bacterium]